MADTRASCVAEAQAQNRQDVSACEVSDRMTNPQQYRACLDTAKNRFDAAMAICNQLQS